MGLDGRAPMDMTEVCGVGYCASCACTCQRCGLLSILCVHICVNISNIADDSCELAAGLATDGKLQ